MSPEIEPITLSPEVPFYLSRENEVYGPHLVGEIQQMLDDRVILPEDMIWMEGWEEWQSLQSVFALESPAEMTPEAAEPDETPLGFEPVAVLPTEEVPVAPAKTESRRNWVGERGEVPFAQMVADRSARRLLIGILVAVLAHALVLVVLTVLAPTIFKVEAYPAAATPAVPPPLEVALEPEEEPAPPVPPPPQPPPPPPPPPEPPPPPAPPIIPVLTPPPPPPEPLVPPMPTPPPITDLPVAPAIPQHAPTHPKKATVKKATVAPVVPTTAEVTNAGPSDYLYAPAPRYDFSLQKRHQGGTVKLRVEVSAQGNPLRVTIEQSSGYSVLDQSALSTVRDSYRFTPGAYRILLVPIAFHPR